jgi:hypothetical protein
MAQALFPAHCILQSADSVLHLASNLVGLAFSFQLLVAEDLSGGFFHGSLGLLRRTFDSIFIHCHILAEGLGSKITAASIFCSQYRYVRAETVQDRYLAISIKQTKAQTAADEQFYTGAIFQSRLI